MKIMWLDVLEGHGPHQHEDIVNGLTSLFTSNTRIKTLKTTSKYNVIAGERCLSIPFYRITKMAGKKSKQRRAPWSHYE